MKTQWKPVEINGSLFSCGIDDLIGIEECKDYDLDNFVSQTKKRRLVCEPNATSKKKRKKRSRKTVDKDVITSPDLLSPSKYGQTNDSFTEATDTEVEENNDVKNTERWQGFGIPKEILRALSELNFMQPTPIQSLTLPSAILGKCDILGAAETGSGKTLAFGIPILTGILKLKENIENTRTSAPQSDSEEDMSDEDNMETGCVRITNNIAIGGSSAEYPLYGLILTPTRELAMQVKNHLDAVAKYTGIRTALVVGGMAAVKQERILKRCPEIVVGTPGRLWELIDSGNSHLSQISEVRFLAIDEADRMLEQGHFQELQTILERMNIDETKKHRRQNFVFSATLTLVHELPQHLKLKRFKKIKIMTPAQKLKRIVDALGVTNPKVVDISEGKGTSNTLTECRITCTTQEKDYYVYYFLKRYPGKTIIFCNSIGCVKRLATLLNLLDCNPLPLHACMQQRQRLKNLERFKENPYGVLLATDVAARGLDIPSAEHILHYQTPRTSESYVHRSGRTARLYRDGIAVLMVAPDELKSYIRLCRTLGKSEDLPIFPVQINYLDAVKERVNLARELDQLQLKVQKASSEEGWFQKAAKEMDIIVDENSKKYDMKEAEKLKKTISTKRKILVAMLHNPIFPKGLSGKYPLGPQTLVQDVHKEVNAIDVMKNAIENNIKVGQRKKRSHVPLFRNKKQKEAMDSSEVRFKLTKKHNSKLERSKSGMKNKRRMQQKH